MPIIAPIPAPTAMPRNGTKKRKPKSSPQNIPPTVPAANGVLVRDGLELAVVAADYRRHRVRLDDEIAGSRSASSIAWRAVVVSSYPIAIRSAMSLLPSRLVAADSDAGGRVASSTIRR